VNVRTPLPDSQVISARSIPSARCSVRVLG